MKKRSQVEILRNTPSPLKTFKNKVKSKNLTIVDLDYCHEPLALGIAQALHVFDIKFTFTLNLQFCTFSFIHEFSTGICLFVYLLIFLFIY